MKRLPKILAAGLFALGAFATAPAQAQVTININPPSWGPAAPASAQYYYLPEVGGYYDLRDQHYVVQRNGQWQRLRQLNGYDRSTWHPVVVDYVGAQPWSRYDEYRRRYPAGLPQGQRKRLDSGKGLPPGQAKKYSADYQNTPGRRYDDDNRQDIRVNPYYDNGKGKGNGNGKGNGKGKH